MMDWSLLGLYWSRYQLPHCAVALLLLLLLLGIIMMTVPPYCRPFSWADPTINYPYVPNATFPTWTLFFFLLLAYATYTVVVMFFGGPLWVWVKAQTLAVILQLVTVNLLKIYAGRIRPDYLSRLRSLGFDEGSYERSGRKNMSAAEYYCNLGDAHAVLREGRLSFPSGHSSTSFAVFTFVSLFCFAYLRPSARGGCFWRLLLSLSPLLAAFLCSVSRTRDYLHNFDDVMAGALIGVTTSLLCFYNAFRITKCGICIARHVEFVEQEEAVDATANNPPIGVVAI